MNTQRLRLTALALVAAASIAMPAQADRTAGERIDDVAIAGATKAALVKAEPSFATEINVEVNQGRILLAGFVDSAQEKQSAIAAAKTVEGGSDVIDALVVAPTKRTMGVAVDDTAVQARLKTGLAKQLGAEKALAINTEVKDGHALLSGFVPDAKYRDDAGKVAASVAGVTEVHNNIAIKK